MNPERFDRLQRVLDHRQPDLTVLMDRVHKPHNLSAILRNCDAVGVFEAHAVPAHEGRLKAHIQVSAGASKWVPLHVHPSIEQAAAHLRESGMQLVAAHPDGDAIDYRELDFTRPTALLVGAELHGVSDEGLALADHHVVLPMLGMARSLNVSVATALLLYEAHRQRSEAGLYDQPRIIGARRTEVLFEWAYPKLAKRCRANGLPYPELSEHGELIEVPAFAAGPAPDADGESA